MYDTIRPDKAITLPFDHLRIPSGTDANGEKQYTHASGQAEVAAGCTANWQSLFNISNWTPKEAAVRDFLAPIEAESEHHITTQQAALLTPAVMFSVDKVEVAIKKLTKGTMPGASGITIDLIADPTWRGEMAKHISRVAIDCFQRLTSVLSARGTAA